MAEDGARNVTTPSLDRYADYFEQLRKLDPEQRTSAIEQLTLEPDERATLERLLAADAAPGDPLASALHSAALRFESIAHQRLGPYRLTRELGSGGMGTVFLAERVDGGFSQAVAIKLLRGFPTQDGLRRLRQERQFLANLDHPNIARLLDGGERVDGQPWLALEYVDGLPLLDYVAQHAPTLPTRIALFEAMLDAVGHAHQRLIIHRDLKPANVMVTASGTVKLLDFGIARLVENDDADIRDTSTRVFTQGYASPEQRSGGAITTASDIYSLGVLLGELLLGRRGDTGDAPRIEPVTLDRELAGILAKAVDENPARRYASAGEFRDDLRRHAEGRPVRAARLTRSYRLRKFVTRHRLPVGAGVVALLALAFFVWRLDLARNHALAAEAVAQTARAASERDAASAHAALDFLTDAFKAASPENTLSRQVGVRDLLDAARRTLATKHADADVTRAMQRLLAHLYSRLGETPIAIDLMRQGLEGFEPVDRVDALRLAADHDELSHLHGENSDGAAALAEAGKAAALREHFAPDDAVETIRSLHALALAHHRNGDDAKAIPLLRDAMARSDNAAPPAEVEVDIAQTLSSLLATDGDCDEALAVVAHGFALIDDSLPADAPDRLPLVRARASALNGCGRAAEAEALLRNAIAVQERVIGPGGVGMMELTNELTLALNNLGRYREAAQMMRRSDVAMVGTGLGGLDEAISLENYAGILESAGDYPAALALYEKARALYDAKHVEADHQQRRRMLRSEARTLALAGQAERGRIQLEDLRERAGRIDGKDSTEYAMVTWQLALVARRMQRVDEGFALLDEATRLWSRLVPPTHPIFSNAHRYRAAFTLMRNDVAGADHELSAAIDAFEANEAPPIDIAVARSELAAVRLRQGQRKEAGDLLAQALPSLREAFLPGEVSRAEAERLATQLGLAP
jgi:serine/threonine protein kinase/tetratricopeptide (TPR) repeat protein